MRHFFTFSTLFILWSCPLTAQLLTQDFSSSAIVTDYVSATPDNGQFTEISASGTGSAVAIESGQLSLSRSSANGCFITRTADFSPTPNLVKVSFDLSVPNVSAAQTSGAILRFGTGYANGTSIPNNANTHTRIGINLTSSGNFTLRDIAGSANSSSFSGQQTITWWINNTGATANYMDPNGTMNSLANDRSDVWVGNTLVFNEMNVATASVSITDMKLNFTDGFATILLDNFVVTAETSLPIELSHFNASQQNSAALLRFGTATEINNERFDIERSANGRTFEKIGTVKGAGTSYTQQDYTYTDEQPIKGINYYRLKQVDFDGTSTYSAVVSVQFGKAGNIVVYPTPATETVNVRLEESFATDAQWQVVDMTGRVVSEGVFAAEQQEYRLPVATLTQGAYVFRITADQQVLTQQFRKQ